jgi:hypothetical protein
VSDLSVWARVLIYAAGAIASAIVLYAVVYLAVRAALRASQAEQREAAARQETLLRSISSSAEYVADVADAWAEGEAVRRGVVTTDAAATQDDSAATQDDSAAAKREDEPAAGESSG